MLKVIELLQSPQTCIW